MTRPFCLPRKDRPRREKEQVCVVCGANFMDGYRHKTCSPECLARSRATRMRRTNLEIGDALAAGPRCCAICGKELSPGNRHKTCSKDCHAKMRALNAAEMSRARNLRRGGMDDASIEAEVDRTRQGWGCDGSISDTDQTIYGNMISL